VRDPKSYERREDADVQGGLREGRIGEHRHQSETGNLRAVQLLLGHTKLESTVRYLGVEVYDALSIAEQIEI
jgi:hypothetical protein